MSRTLQLFLWCLFGLANTPKRWVSKAAAASIGSFDLETPNYDELSSWSEGSASTPKPFDDAAELWLEWGAWSER